MRHDLLITGIGLKGLGHETGPQTMRTEALARRYIDPGSFARGIKIRRTASECSVSRPPFQIAHSARIADHGQTTVERITGVARSEFMQSGCYGRRDGRKRDRSVIVAPAVERLPIMGIGAQFELRLLSEPAST